MTEVVSVKFRETGKSYYFDPKGEKFARGDKVIVETARGLEFGEVSTGNQKVPDDAVVAPLREVARRATEEDVRQGEDNRIKEREAFDICEAKIAEHNLDMKLINVEYAFDRSKILFYFTANGRIDFRDLVKDLAGVFRTRIELRQIGVRDEARMLGGLGACGQPFCCARFLSDFSTVSIKMAKEQGLSLNPTKISGVCGRLMCCLNYEQNCYDELIKLTPKQGASVATPDGTGTVISVSILQQKVKVRLDDTEAMETYDCADVKSLRKPKPQPVPKEEGAAEEPKPAPRRKQRREKKESAEQTEE